MRKKSWLTVVLGALSVVVVVADTGLLGPAAQRAVAPAREILAPEALSASS